MVVFSKVTASKSVPRQLRAVLGEATILKPKICEGGYLLCDSLVIVIVIVIFVTDQVLHDSLPPRGSRLTLASPSS